LDDINWKRRSSQRMRSGAASGMTTGRPRITSSGNNAHLETPVAYDLERFVSAQQRDYDRALSEIRSGQKHTHWMWYVFPQFHGLGSSPTSQRYAIRSAAEARAYLEHAVLGPRLIEAAEATLAVEGRSAHDIFGSPDDLKLRSSATLFASVSPDGSVFHRVLDRFFDGRADERTIHHLQRP
jgi:uncharacterized protein (DUF1810 family)